MRIVAGEFRGRALRAPKGDRTRPTTDRVREALMSTIGSLPGGFPAGARVLDAFAGSGALGLEALSRGAELAVFVERDRAALAALNHNIETLRVAHRCRVAHGDVFALAKRGALDGPFSLILLDPPYTLERAKVSALLEQLADAGSMSSSAIVTWEHAAAIEAVWPEGFRVLTRKRYGTSAIDVGVYEGVASTP